MRSWFVPCLFLWLAALLLPGCSLFKKKPKPDTGPKTTVVGVVEMVNPEQNYVLIRTEQPLGYGAGTELTVMDASGNESKLKLTPEKKGRFLTADIVSGQPQVASLVLHKTLGSDFSRPVPAAPAAPSGPQSVTPGAPALSPMPAPMPFSMPMPLPVTDSAAPVNSAGGSGGTLQLEPEVR